eukprot:374588-Alexandrium_andersonii.AAC.1
MGHRALRRGGCSVQRRSLAHLPRVRFPELDSSFVNSLEVPNAGGSCRVSSSLRCPSLRPLRFVCPKAAGSCSPVRKRT